jgi:hypothetical protein
MIQYAYHVFNSYLKVCFANYELWTISQLLRWYKLYKFAHISSIISANLVAQLAEALRYILEGLGFDFRWCYWNFSYT